MADAVHEQRLNMAVKPNTAMMRVQEVASVPVVATIEVGTVTTGEPGTDASVTNSGTKKEAVLDFVIPRGATGMTGDKGDKGDKGDTGATGATGAQGEPGNGFVIKGYYASLSALSSAVTNPEGGDAYGIGSAAPYDIYVWDSVTASWINNGPLQGAAGEDGITPTIGDNGNWYIGTEDTGKPSRGEQGPQGAQGPQGPQGLQGPKGDNADVELFTGASATNAGTAGFVPAPAAGDQAKFLKGNGTWSDLPSASTGAKGVTYLVDSAERTDTDKAVTPRALNTVYKMFNRSTAVNAADTNYTTLMARGSSLNASETTPAVNGAIAWQYE